MRTRSLIALAGVAAVALVVALAALATDGGRYSANLQPIPHNPAADGGSNVSGSAKMFVKGRQLSVSIHASGLTPNLPHAMHIHGVLGDPNSCPPPSADVHNAYGVAPPDGLIDLGEGAPFYGPIQVSFTTSGDTSAGSGLVLSRMAMADANGNLNYQRTFTIPKAVAKDLTQLHIVVHGLDLNGDGTYSNPAYTGAAALFEATLPVACGTINHK